MKRILLVLALVAISANLTIAQWTAQTSGVSATTQLTSISAIDDNNAWMCAYGPNIIRTTNGGTTWTATTNPAGATDLYNIWAIDANTALVTWSPGTAAGTFVARTTNAGVTWTNVFNQPTAVAFMDAIWMTSSTNGFMYGDPVSSRWSLWKTTNGGINWDSTGLYLAQAPGEAGWNNAMYISGTNIYFGTNVNHIYNSVTNGTTWTSQTTPAANSYSVWFNNSLNGLSGGTGNSYTTINAGVVWTLGTMPGTANVSGITGQDNTWWTIRQGNLIYKTTNNGTTWTTDYTNPTTTTIYNHIAKARTGNRIWACTSTGLISKNDGLVGIAPVSNEIPSSFGLEQNYPNPFNPTTTIRYSIPSASNVTVKIYDMLGNEVMTVVNAYQNAGTYAGPVDASKLASGVYFYTIKAGSFTDTKKMTLIK